LLLDDVVGDVGDAGDFLAGLLVPLLPFGEIRAFAFFPGETLERIHGRREDGIVLFPRQEIDDRADAFGEVLLRQRGDRVLPDRGIHVAEILDVLALDERHQRQNEEHIRSDYTGGRSRKSTAAAEGWNEP